MGASFPAPAGRAPITMVAASNHWLRLSKFLSDGRYSCCVYLYPVRSTNLGRVGKVSRKGRGGRQRLSSPPWYVVGIVSNAGPITTRGAARESRSGGALGLGCAGLGASDRSLRTFRGVAGGGKLAQIDAAKSTSFFFLL